LSCFSSLYTVFSQVCGSGSHANHFPTSPTNTSKYLSTLFNSSQRFSKFNVRAIPQARELSRRDNIEIRYHSIIYELIEDAKLALTGMLDPDLQETFIGYAEIRKVFSVSKIGKIAGCFVNEGIVKKGCSFRLLRDNKTTSNLSNFRY
jgi:translation initiation factor IF-2